MNYKKIYNILIEKAKIRDLAPLKEYNEIHHIIPRCMGGNNDKNNLVKLYPEEHYVAHQLLLKIYPDNRKLIYAAHMLANIASCNKEYGWIRRKYVEANSGEKHYRFGKQLSEEIKQKISNSLTGPNHPMYGKHFSNEIKQKISLGNKGKTRTEETKRKISLSKKGQNHPNYGKHLSSKVKQKISLGNKGKPKSEEHKANLRGPRPSISGKNNPMYGIRRFDKNNPNFGKRMSEEQKQKLSNSIKEAWRKRKCQTS